jgi:hypothetical protein
VTIPDAPIETEPSAGLIPTDGHRALFAQVLAGVQLGAYDDRIVEWLAGWDSSTVVTIVSLIHRARVASVKAQAEGDQQQTPAAPPPLWVGGHPAGPLHEQGGADQAEGQAPRLGGKCTPSSLLDDWGDEAVARRFARGDLPQLDPDAEHLPLGQAGAAAGEDQDDGGEG